MITEPVGHFFLIAAVVHVALLLQRRFAVFRSLGSALVVIVTGILLSNTGILPGQSPFYDFMTRTGVNIAILLVLLSVDLESLRQAGPRMLAAFGLGALGSIVGAIVAALLFSRQVGPETWKLTGGFAGTYIGGGVNFAALATAFETSSDVFTAALASDVILTAAWLAVCLSIPTPVARDRQVVKSAEASDERAAAELVRVERSLYESGQPLTLVHVAGLGAYVLGALWLTQFLSSLFPTVPGVLWLSTLALAAAQVRPLRALPGSAMLGNYMLLLFITCNGARSVVANIMQMGPSIFYFAAFALMVHAVVIFGLGRLLKIDLPSLVVASSANIGSPVSAIAVASARGYTDRLLPGVVVGLVGYAIGNYVGVVVGALARRLLA
jgi:uncharacterized membrane protein